MKFESKYEIGQKLWEIRFYCNTDFEKCPDCGRTKFFGQHWKLDNCEQEIHGINMRDGAIYYKVWRPCVYREMLPESDIGRTFFTNPEDAIAEAARLNKSLERP